MNFGLGKSNGWGDRFAVICINLSGSNAVIRDINRAKDELENILKDLNKAQDNTSNSIYINGLSSYRSSIEA